MKQFPSIVLSATTLSMASLKYLNSKFKHLFLVKVLSSFEREGRIYFK